MLAVLLNAQLQRLRSKGGTLTSKSIVIQRADSVNAHSFTLRQVPQASHCNALRLALVLLYTTTQMPRTVRVECSNKGMPKPSTLAFQLCLYGLRPL